jgi:hypothetical protein
VALTCDGIPVAVDDAGGTDRRVFAPAVVRANGPRPVLLRATALPDAVDAALGVPIPADDEAAFADNACGRVAAVHAAAIAPSAVRPAARATRRGTVTSVLLPLRPAATGGKTIPRSPWGVLRDDRTSAHGDPPSTVEVRPGHGHLVP